MIADLHFDDLQELNKLPEVPFEPVSIKNHRLDNFGRLIMSENIFYYLSPEYAFKKVQVKCTPKELEVYSMEGNFLIKTTRIYGKHGTRFINWSPYIRLLANKPAAILNFSFMELFTNEQTIETIRNSHRTKLHIFLNNFADLIDEVGLDDAVKRVSKLF